MVMADALLNDAVPETDELTVNINVTLVLFTPSLTVTAMLAVPVSLGAGVTVTVRLLPLPPKTMFPSGTSVGLDEIPLNIKLPAAVSASPTVNPIGPTAAPAAVLWFAMLEMVGVSFIAFTVNTKLSLALNCPSLTVTVIVAVPLWFDAGLTVTVRFAPEPPKPMLPFGTNAGLD